MSGAPRVTVEAGEVRLPGLLEVPAGARGVVVFAHGSGSSRHSPRNRSVAAGLRAAGLGTLLFDLLTQREEAEDAALRRWRFDVPRLAERLRWAVLWLRRRREAEGLPLGLFGASTGAAAALVTAADLPAGSVGAVVSRGGRPDLAGGALERVRVPVLLLVGARDPEVLALNRAATARLTCPHRLVVVRGAGHLFEEPGALELVAEHARAWFEQHLRPAGAEAHPRRLQL